jgi:hypothetical protein
MLKAEKEREAKTEKAKQKRSPREKKQSFGVLVSTLLRKKERMIVRID